MLDQLIARAASLVTRTNPPRVFTEIGRHPRLFRAWLPFAGTLLLHGDLPRVDTELVILRTARNCSSQYEWLQHVELAKRAGLAERQIAAIASRAIEDGWTERQRLLLLAVDELHRKRSLTDRTRAALEGVLSTRQLIELCMLVGHYEMLAMVLNTRRVEPDRRTDGGDGWDLLHWSKAPNGRTLVP